MELLDWISQSFHDQLVAGEIPTIPGIVGQVDEVLSAFRCDRLDNSCFYMPATYQIYEHLSADALGLLLQGDIPLFHILPYRRAADAEPAGNLRFVPITSSQQF